MFKVYFWQAEKFTIFLLPGGTNSSIINISIIFHNNYCWDFFNNVHRFITVSSPGPSLPTKSPNWPRPKQFIKKWSPWFLLEFRPVEWLHIFDKPSPLAPKLSQPARPTTTVGPQTTNKKHPGYYYSLCAILTRLKFWLLAFLLLY